MRVRSLWMRFAIPMCLLAGLALVAQPASAGRIQSRNSVQGHAHTDLLDGGKHLDIHLALRLRDDTSDQYPPVGAIKAYKDLRADPPGDATGPFSCTFFTPFQVLATGPSQVYINGLINCGTDLPGAYSFELTVTDGGAPGIADGYHMIISNDGPSVMYDYDGTTTPAYGDLVVKIITPS
jgi:hypothetical protein